MYHWRYGSTLRAVLFCGRAGSGGRFSEGPKRWYQAAEVEFLFMKRNMPTVAVQMIIVRYFYEVLVGIS